MREFGIAAVALLIAVWYVGLVSAHVIDYGDSEGSPGLTEANLQEMQDLHDSYVSGQITLGEMHDGMEEIMQGAYGAEWDEGPMPCGDWHDNDY